MDKIEFFPIDAGSRGGGSKGQQGAARLPVGEDEGGGSKGQRGSRYGEDEGGGSEGSGTGGGKSGGYSEGWRERA